MTKLLQFSRILVTHVRAIQNITHKLMLINKVGVHGFKGFEVQGSILVPELDLECVFTKKTSSSSGLIQNWEPNWQLLRAGEEIEQEFSQPFRLLLLLFSQGPNAWIDGECRFPATVVCHF